MKLRVWLVAAAATCAAALAAPVARAADAVTLQLDWVPSGIAAAWYYGIAQHCFSDRGIDLSVVRGYGAGDAITKIAAGTSAFGVTDLAAIIAGREKAGAPVKAVMPVMPDSPFAVGVMEASPIHALKDLEGKRLAATMGGANMQVLPVGMALAGADFSKIVRVEAQPATLPGLLLQAKVDAILVYVTDGISVNLAAMQVGKKIRIIPYGRALEIYNAALFTSDKLIEERPELVQRFRAGAVCAHDAARQDVAGALDAMVSQVSGMQRENQAELVDVSFKLAFDSPTFEKNGYAWDMARVAHTVELVNQAQKIDAALPAASFVYRPQ